MNTSLNSLFNIFYATNSMVDDYPAIAKYFEPLKSQFDEKQRNPDASIMVYGVYNAGKSTVINALIGDNVAATGDIPLTDRIDEYRWGQYAILDTPGVDAPLEHEQVTREQMLMADAIIFVVNPSGAAEELKTLEVMISLLSEGKKLFLVFNEKNPLSVEDFTRLKNDTRSRLQQLAVEQGMHEILADIPIFRVNAKRALKGKLESKQVLLDNSGYPEFEVALAKFIDSITSNDIRIRLAGELQEFLEYFITDLTQDASNETVRQCDSFLRKLVISQGNLRKEIKKEISRNRTFVYDHSKKSLTHDPEKSQSKIEDIYEDAIENVDRALKDGMILLANQFNDDIDALEAALSQRIADCGVHVNSLKESVDVNQTDQPGVFSRINSDIVNQAIGAISGVAKPEHVVAGLKLVKDWIPSIMKGIGPKTMEKWGKLVVGKWIPYVGTAVTVLSSLWDVFAEDPEEKELRQQSEQHQRERERFMQEVEDIAQNIANQYESAMNRQVAEVLDPWFSEMKKKVSDTLNTASQDQQKNSETLTQAQQLLTRLTTDNV
ncbi:GTPase [Aeromonas salmonicida]|uniref:GTPase n=1 Tax=Aeromonas salmonicida TaxID=645 RepID=UPI003D22DAD0